MTHHLLLEHFAQRQRQLVNSSDLYRTAISRAYRFCLFADTDADYAYGFCFCRVLQFLERHAGRIDVAFAVGYDDYEAINIFWLSIE
jgi:hypothetical protein